MSTEKNMRSLGCLLTLGLFVTFLTIAEAQVNAVEGKVTMLLVQEEDAEYGPPGDEIDVEVVLTLDVTSTILYGFNLRSGENQMVHLGMLALLREAYANNWTVHVEYEQKGGGGVGGGGGPGGSSPQNEVFRIWVAKPQSLNPQEKGLHCIEGIESLRAMEPSEEEPCIFVLGYFLPGDGGGGIFRWNSTSIEVHNSGTIIKPNSINAVDPGRWERVNDDRFSVRWFGAVGDGMTDDTDPVQRTLNAAAGRGSVFIPPDGTFLVTQLNLPSNTVMEGVQGFSKIKCMGLANTDRTGFLIGAVEGSKRNIIVRNLVIFSNNLDVTQPGNTDLVASFGIHVQDAVPIFSGNASSAAPNTLTDNALNMTANAYVGMYVETSDGKIFAIVENTSTMFVVNAGGNMPLLGIYNVITPNEDITIQGCEIYHFRNAGLSHGNKGSGTLRLSFIGNRVHDIGTAVMNRPASITDVAVGLGPPGTRDGIVANNHFWNIGVREGDWALYWARNTWNMTVYGNTLTDCFGGMKFQNAESNYLTVMGNTLRNIQKRQGIILGGGSVGMHCSGNTIAMLRENGSAAIYIQDVKGCSVIGNTIDMSGGTADGVIMCGGESEGVIIQGNLLRNGNPNAPTTQGSAGVFVFASPGEVKDVIISNNAVIDVARTGIDVLAQAGGTVDRILVSENIVRTATDQVGVGFTGVWDGVIASNFLLNPNVSLGFTLDRDSKNIWVHDNFLLGGSIGYAGTDHTIENNRAFASARTGGPDVDNKVRHNFPMTNATVVAIASGITPDVNGSDNFSLDFPSLVTITNFTGGKLGEVKRFIAKSPVTIESNLTTPGIRLRSGLNFDMGEGNTLVLAMLEEGVWHEIGRKE
jgi:hypothetical protein